MADKENVSSFFDGEDRDKRVIEALGSDSGAQASWKSYSVIRDTLRGEAPATLDWDIASSVSAALENEPSYSRDIDHQPAMPANVEHFGSLNLDRKRSLYRLAAACWSSGYRGGCLYGHSYWCADPASWF
nr:sigma-E factor negative regulatory protein [Veronia nyctiphanis]